MAVNVFTKMKFFFLERTAVDSFVSRLNRKWTVIILIFMSIIVTGIRWFGQTINCRESHSGMPLDVTNSMCLHGSLDFLIDLRYMAVSDMPKHYFYYKWVNVILFLHAVLFYFPYLFWKCYENGLAWRVASSIEKMGRECSRHLALENLAKHLWNSRGKYMLYTLLHVLYELSNFIVSIVAIVYLTRFFDIVPVPETIPFNVTTSSDFATFYFPNMTKCTWQQLGASGDLQTHSTVCHMPLNEMYMQIYFFLNGWYIFLAVLSGVAIVCRCFLLIPPPMRIFLMNIRAPLVNALHLRQICYRFSFPDWFFLTRLQKVMMDVDFAELIEKLLGIQKIISVEAAGTKGEETVATSPL